MKGLKNTGHVAVASLACGLLALALAPQAAQAAFTTVKAPDPFNETPEDGHRTILGNIYGGTFQRVGPNNINYTNGTIDVIRVDDSLTNNGVLGLVDGEPGETADQVWHDGFVDAFAKVRFARDQQSFGFWDGASGGSYTKLFDVQGQNYNVTGAIALNDMRGMTWRWGRSRGRGGIHSSKPTDNPDDLDHMVTFKVEGLPNSGGYTVWLLFWEDLNVSNQPNTLTSDRDFQDMVVEIRAIPEPATGTLLLAGLGAVHYLSRRRRRI